MNRLRMSIAVLALVSGAIAGCDMKDVKHEGGDTHGVSCRPIDEADCVYPVPVGGRRAPVRKEVKRMLLLLLFILALLLFGIWGAIKLTLWVLLIAVAIALIAAFLGRGLFTGSRGAL